MSERSPYMTKATRESAIKELAKHESSGLNQSFDTREIEHPILFVNSNGVNEQIWDGVLDIYTNIFGNGIEIERPAYEEILSVLTPTGGELTFYPRNKSKNHPLEVRTKISGHEVFLRFKAYVAGNVYQAKLGDTFQRTLDGYLQEQGLELLPLREIC